MRAAWIMVGLAGFSLSACTVGPDYHRPDLSPPAAFSEAGATARGEVTGETADLTAWWTRFGDPLLDELVRQGLADNPDLQAAESKVRQARQQVRVTAAAELPSLDASGNAVTFNSNRKTPRGAGTGAGAGGFEIPSNLNLYSAGFDASWEVDLFGGTRRGIEAAKAQVEETEWRRRDGEVSLAGEIANDYFTLRALQTRIAIGEAELQRQKDLFGLVGARRQAGFVTELDTNQQSTQVSLAAAQIPQLESQVKIEIHALSILLGQPPEALADRLKPVAYAPPATPPRLPIGLPSDLLQRRPDVRAAERGLAAANAQIGVEEANLFPKLNLIGLASFADTSLASLFSTNNFATAAVGMASEPIFNAGKTRAGIAAAREARLQALDAYRSTALAAFRDVEDALARYRSEDDRRASLAQAAASADKSLRIAQDQYAVGLVNLTTVLQAQTALLSSQDQLTQSDAQVQVDLVSLYKALGGGWTS
jgi:NodT family efflux transporter outer membrane factor (OMF) lipoprotein